MGGTAARMKRALVTGGGGFLGSAIVDRLLDRGVEVRSFSRGDYPELECRGVTVLKGDLVDERAVVSAAEGCDAVFHVAAKPGVWGPYEEYYRANVTGTVNVISACKNHSIRKLIYTSSPSVVFDGKDMEGVDETVPYPDHHEAHYADTKAQAERLVLASGDVSLAVVSLRPHIIWGPGDRQLIPRLLERARAGALRRVGPGTNVVDTVYIDNAADAHLLAADRLEPGSAIDGKVYFITQGDPQPLWPFINRILAAAGLPPVTKSISVSMAYAVGWVLETVYGLFGIESEPRMTRFLAGELATAHWFDISAARRDLGYEPKVSVDEGLRRLETWFDETGQR